MSLTWIRRFRQKLLGRNSTVNCPSLALRVGVRRPRKIVPQIETLEDKIVPSTTMQPTFVLLQGIGASSGPSGYAPLQLRTSYGVNNVLISGSPGTGTGETIAIVDAYNDPNIVSDVDSFDKEFAYTSSSTSTLYAQFGAASSFLTVYNENGTTITPSTTTTIPVDSTGGWEVEESLDVEWAHSMAPGAKIDLIEATSDSTSDLFTAVTTAAGLSGVSVVSMSWGTNEYSGETSNDGVFTTPAGHQGVTFVASTGDDSVGEYPAFSPNVIAVGGTTLTLTSGGTIASETAWSSTGGGTSLYEPKPAYQDSVQPTSHRTIPDVAFDADPNTGVAVYDSYKYSGWLEVGGTSLSSPSFAGIMALANQGRAAANLPTFNSSSNAQQALTALYSMPSSDFHDVTSGQITANGVTYKAGPGYDEVSGLGSPVANSLVAGLAAYGGSSAPTATQVAFISQPPSSFAVGTTFSATVQLESATGAVVDEPNVNVTLTLTSGTFSNGSATVTASTNSSGQATFSMVVTATGTYTLTPSGGLTGKASSSFKVTSSASQLAFSTQPPGSVPAGTSFTAAAQLENSSGPVLQSGVTVTLALSPGSFGTGSVISAVTNAQGLATFTVIVDTVGTGYTLTATATPVTTTLTSPRSAAFTVTSVSDWFSQHIGDLTLQNLARTDFDRDGAITYSDMLGLFAAAEAEAATLSSTTLASLQALVAGASTLKMPTYVSNLAGKVVDGDPANATYQSLSSSGSVVTVSLGNLAAGSSSTQLAELVNKWFLGVDEPTTTTGAAYSAVSGVLFGSSGPSYADVYQGDLGDCTVLASMAEVAARDNSAIVNMFTYDGTSTINGATVGVWTVRFFENGTPTYVTVDGELPAGGKLYDEPVSGVLWVALAEKAYVELNQSGWLGTLSPGPDSYQAINSGSQGTIQAALSALTGLSNSAFNTNSTMVAADMAGGELVVIATGNTVASSVIVNNHAYAVVGYTPSSSMPFEVFSPWGVNGGYENGVYKYGLFICNAAFLSQNFVLAVASPAAADVHTDGGAFVPNDVVDAELTRSGDVWTSGVANCTSTADFGSVADAGPSGNHEDALQAYLDGEDDSLMAILADHGELV